MARSTSSVQFYLIGFCTQICKCSNKYLGKYITGEVFVFLYFLCCFCILECSRSQHIHTISDIFLMRNIFQYMNSHLLSFGPYSPHLQVYCK